MSSPSRMWNPQKERSGAPKGNLRADLRQCVDGFDSMEG